MAALDFLSPIFGSKPQIADYQPVNLQTDQLKAIEGDIAAWPDIANLGNMFQQYMLNQYETAIPGFRDILKMGGTTTQDMLTQADQELHGQLPQDVQDAVQRYSAQQNLGSGLMGSAAGGANAARNLGLTSLDLIGQGANLATSAGNAAQRWAALSGAQMPQGMLVTPEQQAQLDLQQNLIERNVQQQKYNVAAAPDPAFKGLSDIVANLTAAYLSKGGGSGGGAPQPYGATQMGVGNVTSDWGSNATQGTGGGFTDVGNMFAGSGSSGIVPSNSWLPSGSTALSNQYDFSGLTPYTGNYMAPNLYGTSDFNFTTAGTG